MQTKYKDFHLVIAGRVWEVKFNRPTISDTEKLNPDADFLGLCDTDALTIYITQNQPEKTMPTTLFHEITHACLIDASRSSAEVSTLGEEFVAEAMGNRLDIIIPQLPTWLLKIMKQNYNNIFAAMKRV